MSLENWLQNGWLTREEPSLPELQKLLQVVDRERHDAAVEGLSDDGRFEHGYTAGLQLCVVALRASGFRQKGTGHHARAIESLRFTLGPKWSEMATYLSRCNQKRSQAVYDHVGVVESEDVTELIEAIDELRTDVINWLKVNHPLLVPPGLSL